MIQKLRRSFCIQRELLGYLLVFKNEAICWTCRSDASMPIVISILLYIKLIFRLSWALALLYFMTDAQMFQVGGHDVLYKNSKRDEITNVNIFTTTSYM